MALKVVKTGVEEVPEPNWSRLVPGIEEDGVGLAAEWRDRAHEEWQRVIGAMRAAGTLGSENRHQIQRLVLAYLRYEIAAACVMKFGAIVLAKRTRVPQLSLWQVEMRAADSDATTAEQELGLTPRRRGAVTKKAAPKRALTAADAYVKKRS